MISDMEVSVASAQRRAPFIALGVALAGCAYLAVNDPNDPGALMPTCPTKALTGLSCPLCGGLRMTRSLLYGDLRAAARANALLLLAMPVVALLWVLWCRDALAGRPRRPVPGGRATTWIVLVVAAAWTAGRNLA
jgi:hypothetical protein